MSADLTPFHDLDAYVALPRLSRLVLSRDGGRLVTAVGTLDPEGIKYVSALWEVDPTGKYPARRLTRSTKGESPVGFGPDGDLVFVSARPDPEAKPDPDDEYPALWVLPAGGGEARVVASRPGGITAATVARNVPVVAVLSPTLPGAVTAQDDAERRKRRKESKVSAILHESYPVRYWDHDLGPDQPRLLSGTVPADGRADLCDLTPTPGTALQQTAFDITPDGRTVVTTWKIPEAGGARSSIAVLDTGTGVWRLLLDDPEREFESPVVSPDGRRIALIVVERSTAVRPPRCRLAVADLDGGELRVVAEGWDRWPVCLAWASAGTALIVTADEAGASPVFRVELASDRADPEAAPEHVVRLTGDRGCYTDLQVSPDGRWVYALRSSPAVPPAPVRLDARQPGQQPTPLQPPAPVPELPGTLCEVFATADDGTRLRGWLALPSDAGPERPASLLLWIHGGPLHSWNSWSWRWNPWLMVARGYAVLLPDPALSTGYGQNFVARGWGAWGAAPYTDLMTITDAAQALDTVDAQRTAAMGGSFGGYMANWIAGHTDRFRGIVSHAGLWALDQFGRTTDAVHYWRREMTEAMEQANSPHRFVDRIVTPMLVVHGDRDYRVPIGEALRLWADLTERGAPDGPTPHRFLYFPDENHWILTPNHAKVWYETVFAFLATTVLGEPWQTPELLC